MAAQRCATRCADAEQFSCVGNIFAQDILLYLYTRGARDPVQQAELNTHSPTTAVSLGKGKAEGYGTNNSAKS